MSASVPEPAAPATGARDDLRPLALAVVIPVVVALVLVLFIWPGLRAAPEGLELGVVGTPATAADVASSLDRARPGAFDVTAFPDADAARQAVRDRAIVGALVPGEPVTAVTATAGSPFVAQLVQTAARALPASAPPRVEDVVPPPVGDPRGVVLSGGGLLPLTIAGIALGAVTALQRARARLRLSAALLGAAVSGLLFVAVMQSWLDALGGSYLVNAGAVALAVAAVALPVLGFIALLGQRGIGLAALVMVVLGNSLSGAATSPDLLPTGFGQLGQLLPAGATASLLRSTSGFDGTGATGPVLVLAAWALFGACAAALGKASLHGHDPAPAEDPTGQATVRPRGPVPASR